MALPPGIPTSFVPHQPVQPQFRRPQSTGNNIFLILGLVIAGVAAAAAAGTFAYQHYLTAQLNEKATELAAAQARVNETTIEDFIRLRDRLTNGSSLLTNHVLLSQFFDAVERLTLQNVRFNTLSLSVAGDHTAKLDVEGTARNFNSLAAQSTAFAGERAIKRAIFSGITLNDARQVTFRLTADIDSRLIIAGATGVSAPAADALSLPVAPVPAANATTTTPRPVTTTVPRTGTTTTP